MAFRPYEGQGNVAKSTSVPMATSTAITAGQALVWSSGLVIPATSGATEVNFVAKESKTSGASDAFSVEVWRVSQNTLFEVDTAANTAAAQRGVKYDLTDANTLNNAATTNKVFQVESLVGAAADKKVVGYFVPKTT